MTTWFRTREEKLQEKHEKLKAKMDEFNEENHKNYDQ